MDEYIYSDDDADSFIVYTGEESEYDDDDDLDPTYEPGELRRERIVIHNDVYPMDESSTEPPTPEYHSTPQNSPPASIEPEPSPPPSVEPEPSPPSPLEPEPSPQPGVSGLAQIPEKAQSQGKTQVNDSADDDGQTCTICFDQWTNSSEHRLVSLRCGHLFGRSCITRWLKGQNARCPQCNARARKSEIRNIYAKAVKVMDTTERDKALRDLQKESELRRKAEMEASHERMKYQLTFQECERLKSELLETNKLLMEYRCGLKPIDKIQSNKPNASIFTLEKSIEIARHGGCRIVEVANYFGMILISQPSINELFPGYGLRKVSSYDMKASEFILIHQKPIKDLSFRDSDGLALTASLDKSVKITSLLSNSVVHTYSVDSDVWSCAWDEVDPTYFYAGLKTGDVYLFDIRTTARHVHELPRYGNKTPVVSLQYLKKTSCPNHSKGGPLVGKLSDCVFYPKLDQPGEYKTVPLPILGPFTSVSSDRASGHFLVSSRPSPKQPRITHSLCGIGTDQVSQNVVCNPVQVVQGGRTQVQLTRSKLFIHPNNSSSLLIGSGDEDAHGALIWDGSSGKCVDTLKTDSLVFDLANLIYQEKSLFCTLTDKNLRLYSWNSQ